MLTMPKADGQWSWTAKRSEALGASWLTKNNTSSLALPRTSSMCRWLRRRASVIQRFVPKRDTHLPMFCGALFDYTNMSRESALGSSDAVLRSLALLDARLGKRRLKCIRLSEGAPELEQACLRVRLEGEGIAVQTKAKEFRS